MIFQQITTGGCQSYLVGCGRTCSAVLIDPALQQFDRYLGLAAREGLRIRYVVDTHTHADHFSAVCHIKEHLGVPAVMHRDSMAPYADLRLDHGDMLIVGDIRVQALHTPGHTNDSICLLVEDRLFTGDTLLIGGTGRTDLPTGDPDALHDSLFNIILKLDPALKLFPAHDYHGRTSSTIAQELTENPRLQYRDKQAFSDMMRRLNQTAPDHMTEALRTNMSGGKTVEQLLTEAASKVPFMALSELLSHLADGEKDLIILDVRERGAYEAGHIPGARHLPRGQLELRVNQDLPDPTLRILTVCELGKVSTLAAATLRELGFRRATALDGGMKAWRENRYPVERAGAGSMGAH